MSELKHLLSPITIKKTEIPNRMVMPPMGTGLCNPDGTVNNALLAYMNRQASSGAGLIISEIVARKRLQLYVCNCLKKHPG